MTVQLFNVSMLTPDGEPTRRARVLLRPVEVTQSRFVGELPMDGIAMNSDVRIQILLINYPNCAPEESFILRVGCEAAV